MADQTESKSYKYKKVIHLTLGNNFYKLEWDGYQYAITIKDGDCDRKIYKYPTNLTSALRIIFREEMVNEKDPEPISLMEYARQIDDMVRNLSSENFDILEEEMKSSQPMSEETKAKIKATKLLNNQKPAAVVAQAIEDDEEDDI